MNLDFTLLSRPASVPPTRKPWGQAGTVGTQAFMRVSAPLDVGDSPGTSGDGGATVPSYIGKAASAGGFPGMPCPQGSPPCPHSPEARRPHEITVSPVSPPVPGRARGNASGKDFDFQASEEPAANGQYGGGYARDGEPQTDADERRERVVGKLQAEPGLRCAMETHINADPEAVILSLAIRGKGVCDLRIPKSRYDAFALLDMIEKHTTQKTLQ